MIYIIFRNWDLTEGKGHLIAEQKFGYFTDKDAAEEIALANYGRGFYEVRGFLAANSDALKEINALKIDITEKHKKLDALKKQYGV